VVTDQHLKTSLVKKVGKFFESKKKSVKKFFHRFKEETEEPVLSTGKAEQPLLCPVS
jgi:hypothetical protein